MIKLILLFLLLLPQICFAEWKYNPHTGKLDYYELAGGAPDTAPYLTSTANGSLSAEVDLGALTSGFLYGTVAGGTSTISSVDTAAVTNGAATLSTGDQIYDFVIGLGYLTAEVDGSVSNEINTFTLPDANVTAGLGITFAQSGSIAITESVADTVLFTVTETDPAITAGDHITRTVNDLDIDDDFLLNSGDTSTGALVINNNNGIDNEDLLTIGDADDLDNIKVYGNVDIGGDLTVTDITSNIGPLTINDNDGVDNEIMLTVGDADDLDSALIYGKLGIGLTPAMALNIHQPGSTHSYAQWTNGNTGTTATDGLIIGYNSGGNAYVWNYENENIILGANNAIIATILPTGLTLATGKNLLIGTTQWNSGDSIDGTKVANADLGDIGVSSGVWSVEDDSHNHVIANIDAFTSAALYGQISDETGSASGSPLAVFNQNPTINGATLTGTIDAGGAVLEIPNGTSGTTDATGETYLDTNGDTTNVTGPIVQLSTNGATLGYLFPIAALPLAASQDNYIMKYDATGKTIQWEAEAAGGSQSKSFIITNPTSSADSPVWRTPAAITISAVHVLCVGGTNVVGQLWEYDANGANGAVVDSSDITATAGTNANDDGALSNASIDSGDYVGWVTTSVSGSPTKVIVTFDYS